MNSFFAPLWIFHRNKGILLCTLLQNLSTLHSVNHLKLLQITIALFKRATVWPILLGFIGGEEHSGRIWWPGFNLSLLMEHNRGHRYFRMQTISHLFYLFQESSNSLCCVCKDRLTVIWVFVNFIICNSVFAHWLNYQRKFCFPSCAWRWHICQVNFALILQNNFATCLLLKNRQIS